MSGINNIVLGTPADELEKVLSPFIREQFPSFARSDYGKLILFIKSYYEWLEKKNNPGYVLMNLDTVSDVDENAQEFYSHFKSTYLEAFPELLAVSSSGDVPNKNTLLKKIREFYGKKGTESAYKFLFRVLYDSDLEIYYPSSDLLKASDGEWIEPVSVKTTSTNGTSLFGGKGGYLYQYNGVDVSASGFINSVVQYSFSGFPITEFFVSDINGTFNPDQEVTIVNGDQEWVERTYSVLGDFYVESPGSGYRIGDTITLFDENGKGFSAKIQQTGLAGGVKKIDIINSGVNYGQSTAGASADYFLLSIFSDTGQQSAKVYGKRSALTRYPGYFSGNRGKLSSNKKIQDSNFYQSFSYELKSAVSIDTYFDVLKRVVHPAGTKMFGSVLLKNFLVNNIVTSTQSTIYETPVIGKYTPYKTTTAVDLRNNGVTDSGYWLGATGDLYPLGYNPYIGSTSEVGPSGTTTSLGTVFVGNSLGYTWCYVPEDGRTAHNPIGAPLGSTTAWYSGKETSWSPAGLRGLVLWLRPETIGVCGSVVNGASVDIWRDSSPNQNHAVPPTWGRFNGMSTVGAGITIDKLRPVLVTASSSGITGISFNGGPVFSPHSVFGGATFGAIVGLGFTTGAGSSAAAVLNGQHLYLTNQLSVTDDADIFVVYRPTIEGLSHGYGLLASRSVNYNPADPSVRLDSVIFSRPYNVQDRTPAFQTSQYYSVTPLGTLLYPGASLPPVGAVGFRPSGDQQSVTQNYIVYDPHVSGVCFGVSVAEAVRDSDNRIRVYLNGDEGLNRSRSTGRVVAEVTAPTVEDFLIRKGLILYFDGKSILSRGDISDAYSTNLLNSYVTPWVHGNVISNINSGRMSSQWNPLSSTHSTSLENNIVYDRDPWGRANLIWKAQPTDATTTYSADGGWNGPLISIDTSKTYRFSFWLNRKVWGTGLNNGGTYYVGVHGYNSSVGNIGVINRTSGGSSVTNYYFTAFNPSTDALPQNTWQLVCHHMHPVGSGIGSNHPDSGYYLLSTGLGGKRVYGSDAVWTPNTTFAQFRTYLFYASTNEAVQQWLYPRVDVVDGNEPSVQELLNDSPNTWKDISPTGLTFSAAGGLPYSAVNDGILSLYGGNYLEWKTPTLSVADESSISPYKRKNRFTFEAWIKPTVSATDSLRWFLGTTSNGSDQYIWYDSASQNFIISVCAIRDVQHIISLPVNTIQRNKWSQFVLQIDGKRVLVYVDGRVVEDQIVPLDYIGVWDATNTDGDGTWTIGQRSPATYFLVDAPEGYTTTHPNQFFKGDISNIRLYNRILGSNEIVQNYNVLRSRFGV